MKLTVFPTIQTTQIYAGNGVYDQVLHNIRRTGVYVLELLHLDAVVLSVDAIIHAGPPDPYFSIIGGSGLGNDRLSFDGCNYMASSGTRLLVAGVSYHLHVTVRDTQNNSYNDVINVRWDDRFAAHVTSTIDARGENIDIAFVPRTVGADLPFRLLVDGSAVFSVVATIIPGPPTDIIASMPIENARVGEIGIINVRVFDAEGNQLTCCCEATQMTVFFTDQNAVASIGTIDRRLYNVDREEIGVALPETPGFYSVDLEAGGLMRNVLPRFLVRAGAVDPSKSYLQPSTSRLGRSSDLILVMVDRFNNSVPSIAPVTNITIIPSASVGVSVGASDVLLTFTNFTREGEHLIYVSVDFEPISTYPFRIVVQSHKKPENMLVRNVSQTTLIAIGVVCAACSAIFVAGLCANFQKTRSLFGRMLRWRA